MSASYFRLALGALGVLWALEAAAQDYSAERASPPGSESYDSYVADPAESYVTEGDDASAETAAPRAPVLQYRAPEQSRAPYQPPVAALEPQWPPRAQAPYCRAYFPAGPGRDRSGTLCEQSDGALRLVKTPAVDMRRGVYAAASSQYCREYQQPVVSDGREQTSFGRACWQRDGSWQIISAPAMAVTYSEPPPQRPRPAERRLKMPEFYFGNLFGWLRPRDERY